MDRTDAEKYTQIYQLLAEVLERDHDVGEEHPMSYALGDLARRVFVGTRFDPPDELLEQTAHAIRSGDRDERQGMAQRLRVHARHLHGWDE